MSHKPYFIKSVLSTALLFATSMSCSAETLNVTITNSSAGVNQCMDLKSDKKGVTFTQCNDSATQKWKIETAAGKFHTIKNISLSKDKCLFSTTSGNMIEMRACDSGAYSSQTYWDLVTTNNLDYSLRSKVQTDYRRSGWLSVADNALELNTEKSPSRKWRLNDTRIMQMPVTNTLAGLDKCMDLSAENNKVVFNTCNNSDAQQWQFEEKSGYTRIKNLTLDENTCLFTSINGSAISMNQCDSGYYSSQNLWTLSEKSPHQFSFISKVQRDIGKNGELSVNSDNALTLNDASAASGNWRLSQFKSPKRNFKGELKVLLLNTHFTGAKEGSTEAIKKALFGGNGDYSSLNEYLSLASRGQLTLKEAMTLDNMDIGVTGGICDSGSYKKRAMELAKTRGVNPDDYDVVVVEHTKNGKCGYAANATFPTNINKTGKHIVSNASGHKYWMWSHEFGHMLGFKHSNILINCPAIANGIKIDDSCKLGGKDGGGNDISDTMGGGGRRMYPVNYMYDAGWLNDRDFPVVGNGTYKIDPLLEFKGGKQGLRIARNNPAFPYLTLEFRKAEGFDDNWDAESPFINGVIVRQVATSKLTSYNVIVQTNPNSSDRNTPPLMPGKTLVDTYSGKKITVNSVGKDGATVTIEDYTEADGLAR